jgi:hypothetical protein
MERTILERLQPRIWALAIVMALFLVSCPGGSGGGY